MLGVFALFCFFFFNDTATTEIYTLSLHDALPISIAVADARPVREQRVAIGEVGVCVERDGRHFQLAGEGAPVQGFDVAELVHVAAVAGVDPPRGERPEHESVLPVPTVRPMNRVGGLNHHASPSRRSPPPPARGT